MLSAITTYMPRWLMAIIATALVLATVVGSSQDSAEAIDPADTDTVYIADGTNFADALVGATIASLNTSPMLGVAGTNGGDTIPGDTADELDRLTNDKNDPLDTIYVFGGTSAVSADVANQLGQWADDVQRIEGDSRWGTYEAISQMLPSAIDEAVHAQEADHATTADSATEADNADTLDGNDSTDFLGANDKAADSDQLDGMDSSAFLGATEQAADSDQLDGLDSSAFAHFGEEGDIINYLVEMNKADPPVVFAEFGPIAYTASCQDDAGSTRAIVDVRSSSGPWYLDGAQHSGGTAHKLLDFSTSADTPAYQSWFGQVAAPGAGVFIADDGHEHTVFLEHGSDVDCVFAGTFFPHIRGTR